MPLSPHLWHHLKMKELSNRLVQHGITVCITMPFRKEQNTSQSLRNFIQRLRTRDNSVQKWNYIKLQPFEVFFFPDKKSWLSIHFWPRPFPNRNYIVFNALTHSCFNFLDQTRMKFLTKQIINIILIHTDVRAFLKATSCAVSQFVTFFCPMNFTSSFWVLYRLLEVYKRNIWYVHYLCALGWIQICCKMF